ncbi:MAG TPA: cysteine--tRNA ligase [Ignavibacteriaceae bacterium]|nr:cysteine--tRNA ligase [Ignavibacteriaceae bacterium]
MLTIYNTLNKRKEEFKPIKEGEIKMYVCGPTVYDYFHIGNARTFIMSDIIRKYLEYKGYKVTYLMNLTDIDDKIIKKSIEEKKDARVVAENYINAFFEDIEKLKVKKADDYPKATAHIDDIVAMIKKLVDKGAAYNVDGNVFYDVSKFNEYGKLSGKKIDELESGARIEINEAKKNPLDFSLWKKAKEGEPFWDSPWGKGRPGWHIECSAMSCKHLGETFDIHAGGNDLIFPHHENEIAQSEAATGKHFVNYWIHFGFLNIDNQKMSKSLGNFFTARDVLKTYPAEVLRFFFAQTYYRGPLNYSIDLLNSAQKGLEKIQNLYERLVQESKNASLTDAETDFDFKPFYAEFERAMDDDFNTAQGIALLFDFSREANKYLSDSSKLNKKFVEGALQFLNKVAVNVFSIINTEGKQMGNSIEDELINLLISIRLDAKKNKNFALSDKIRDDLKELGIILQDSKEGTTYKRA